MSVIEEQKIIDESFEQLEEFVKNKRFVHYVGMLVPPRPGVAECMTLVEHTHFKPGTEKNELFIMRIIEWSEMVWVMMSIPHEDKSLVEKIAKECGLRIANGVPTAFTRDSIQQFPVNNERIFTFENVSGHPIYRNDPGLDKTIFDAEKETMEKISKH